MKPSPTTTWFDVMTVAPRAGAWIETHLVPVITQRSQSPPARGRGLKQGVTPIRSFVNTVAPPAAAGIETGYLDCTLLGWYCRPPRGGVD